MNNLIDLLRAGCIVATLSLGVLAPVGAVAQTAAASAARAEDYATFRKLAEPLHIFDMYVAINIKLTTKVSDKHGYTAAWRAVFFPALEDGLNQQRDEITDLIMRQAFTSFDHDEITRLTSICTLPGLERYEQAKVRSIRSGGDGNLPKGSADAPDFSPLSDSDLDLLIRLLGALDKAMDAPNDAIDPTIRDAWHKATAAAPQ